MNESNFYSNYMQARNKAWEIIFKFGINSLPVPISKLCNQMDIRLFSYIEADSLIKAYKLTEYTKNDGFATIIQNNYVIFYNENIPKSRIRFTIAHEIGHIVLGDLIKTNPSGRSRATSWNIGEQTEPDPCEAAANIFASRLLAPACVLWKLGIDNADEISLLCGLSKSASQIRANRMKTLCTRKKFIASPLEAKVLEQFYDFISSKQNSLFKKDTHLDKL